MRRRLGSACKARAFDSVEFSRKWADAGCGCIYYRRARMMMERRQIVKLWRREPAGVLVTLVLAEGSSYRRPGARLLVGLAGNAGTLSGGCLDAEVVRKAPWMVRAGAKVERYSMLFESPKGIFPKTTPPLWARLVVRLETGRWIEEEGPRAGRGRCPGCR